MDEANKAQRLIDLKSRFEEGACFTIERMMEEYGITRRTANRDLLDLGTLGVELVGEKGEDGCKLWRAARRSQRFSVTYTLTELMALFLGRRFFDFLSDTILEEKFDRVLDRVESQLAKSEHRDQAKKLKRKLYLVHEGPKKLKSRSREILDDCLTGLLKEQKLKVKYVSANGTEYDLTLRPYTLVAFKRGLYLLAAVEEWNGMIARLALERVKSADWLKGEAFDYPEAFDPEKFLSSALFLETGKPEPIEILFTPSTRPFIEFRRYHRTQKLEMRKDGRLRLAMKVPIGFEVTYWILSFGANAEVVSPPELRERVAEELRAAAKQYS
jgi:proteasome accessory factor B